MYLELEGRGVRAYVNNDRHLAKARGTDTLLYHSGEC